MIIRNVYKIKFVFHKKKNFVKSYTIKYPIIMNRTCHCLRTVYKFFSSQILYNPPACPLLLAN